MAIRLKNEPSVFGLSATPSLCAAPKPLTLLSWPQIWSTGFRPREAEELLGQRPWVFSVFHDLAGVVFAESAHTENAHPAAATDCKGWRAIFQVLIWRRRRTLVSYVRSSTADAWSGVVSPMAFWMPSFRLALPPQHGFGQNDGFQLIRNSYLCQSCLDHSSKDKIWNIHWIKPCFVAEKLQNSAFPKHNLALNNTCFFKSYDKTTTWLYIFEQQSKTTTWLKKKNMCVLVF